MLHIRSRLGAALLCLLVLAGCKEALVSDLSESAANEIVAALLDIGIPASKQYEAEGVTVMVDASRFAEAIRHLGALGLPRTQYETFGDVFQGEGMVPTQTEERARYIYALSQELSSTIASIDGVLEARVHIVLPESDMLGQNFQPSSASVFIKHSPDAPVSQFASQIKLLVANSVEGLDYELVTVISIAATESDAPQATAPQLASFAGVWVHGNSLLRLQLMMAGLGGLAILGFATAGAIALGQRRGRARDAELENL